MNFPSSRQTLWHGLGYVLLLLIGAGAFAAIQHYGGQLTSQSSFLSSGTEPSASFTSPSPDQTRPAQSQPAMPPVESLAPVESGPHLSVMFHILLTLSVVILAGNVLGQLCRKIGQPPVIGEVLAGIALGPSLLGLLYPAGLEWLIPSKIQDPHGLVSTALKSVAGLGVVLYMFLVGLELNGNKLKHRMGAAVAISHTSIIIPFVLGAALSLWLYPKVAPEHVSFMAFSMFCGVAMSITAFPVLARILTDRKLQNTYLGSVAIGCAAADDVTAWCLLAVVIGVVEANVGSSLWVVGSAIVYMALMFWIVRPGMKRWVNSLESDRDTNWPFIIATLSAGLMLSACLTEAIGVHALFGAFLLGAVIPSNSRIATEFTTRFRDPVQLILLPAFFAYTGLRTEIGLVRTPEHWCMCLIIIAVATLGKFGGTLLAAKLSGEGWRESAALGTLMNTRGLMELIVLNIGLELGVISPLFFTMMVIMAVVTTMITSPILQWLTPKNGW